jgi:hypothetical protein
MHIARPWPCHARQVGSATRIHFTIAFANIAARAAPLRPPLIIRGRYLPSWSLPSPASARTAFMNAILADNPQRMFEPKAQRQQRGGDDVSLRSCSCAAIKLSMNANQSL